MTPFVDDQDFTLYVGDVREVLATLPACSVNCCVTSPPYWGLRDYGNAGQIGLEDSPDAFVAVMVDVFREVHRVLADDGTLWLNLGDSYSHGGNGARDIERWPKQSRNDHRVEHHNKEGGKPKDLVGIPWRVARALQEPYYTGAIKEERERVWLAAMIDAEGCIFVHKRKAGTDSGAKFTKADGTERSYARTQDTYGSGLEISNTSRAVVERALAIVGKGSISESTRRRNQPLYRWNLRTNECREVLREVYPFLVAKQHQARIAIGCPASGDKATLAHSSLIALHNGAAASIDFPAPAALYEQGWYLRSDVIWSKSNPMPESVTDRPTKSHEYVFLLSKSPSYYFDQEAVREPHSPDGRKMTKIASNGAGVTTHENYEHRQGAERWPGAGRNIRTVWEIATQPYAEAHFATFPEELPRRCIAAGCPEWVCATCGKPRERLVEKPGGSFHDHDHDHDQGQSQQGSRRKKQYVENLAKPRGTVGWTDCGHDDYRPGVVFDPFMGSGTTALVARKINRRSIGIELSPEYAALCARRLQQLSLLA